MEKYYSTAAEIREVLASFKLEGREIRDLHTSSYDYLHDVYGILGEADRYVCGEGSDSRRNCFAYVNLPKRTKFARRMELDEPLVVEFKDGDTFKINISMEPDYYLSLDHTPYSEAGDQSNNVDPSYMFSDVVGKRISSVRLETQTMNEHPWYKKPYPEATEVVLAINLCLENGCRLRLSGWCDNLEVESQDWTGVTKKVSWESIRDGITTPADLAVDRMNGFIARGNLLMFGRKGARLTGGHRVTFAPGPGWRDDQPSGREAFISPAASSVLGMALVMTGLRFLDLKSDYIDLAREEWDRVLRQMGMILTSGLFARADRSATVRAMFATDILRNDERSKERRVGDSQLAVWFLERQTELLRDLTRWTKRVFGPETVLRVTGL